jgi:hypothetical protein
VFVLLCALNNIALAMPALTGTTLVILGVAIGGLLLVVDRHSKCH